MKIFLLLPLLLGFSVPAIAHNEFNGGEGSHWHSYSGDNSVEGEEGEGAETEINDHHGEEPRG